jgi:hypothetical protein
LISGLFLFFSLFTPTPVWVQKQCWENLSFPKNKNEWVRVVYTNPQLAALKQSKEPGVTLGCQFSKIMKPFQPLTGFCKTKNQVRKPTLNCWFFATSFINTARFFEYFHKAKTTGFLALNFFQKSELEVVILKIFKNPEPKIL